MPMAVAGVVMCVVVMTVVVRHVQGEGRGDEHHGSDRRTRVWG